MISDTSGTMLPENPGRPPLASQPPSRIAGDRLEHRVYGGFDEVHSLQPAWDSLAARCGDIHCSFDWCQTWWRYFDAGRQLEIHVLSDARRLVAVLPLFRETIYPLGTPLRVIQLVGCDYTTGVVGLALEPSQAALVMRRLLAALPAGGGWDVLNLGPLRSYADAAERMAEAAAELADVQAVIIGRRNDWVTLFDLPETYDAYLQGLPGDERRDTARRERKLREGRQVEIRAVTDPAEVPAAMDALIHWHQTLWIGKGDRGQFGDANNVADFHREIADRLARTGQLLLVTLAVDGQVLGAAYGHHFGTRSHSMFRGYCNDEPWRSYALGRLLHCSMVRQAIEHGSTVLEDGRGIFQYKLRLGGQLHGERSLTLVRRGWNSRLRFWTALRAAYLIHVLYSRLWIDTLAPRLGRRPPARDFYVRSRFLAQLYRRIRFRLLGGPAVQETRCLVPSPQEGPAAAP